MKKITRTMTPQMLPAPGARVGSVDGPGRFPQDDAGTVLCHVTDRWGTHAVVLFDAGDTRKVHGLTSVGIGTHLISGQATPAGFVQEYEATCTQHDMRILVTKETDLDSTFLAWDIEAGEFISINGWLWEFDRIEPTTVENRDCGPETS